MNDLRIQAERIYQAEERIEVRRLSIEEVQLLVDELKIQAIALALQNEEMRQVHARLIDTPGHKQRDERFRKLFNDHSTMRLLLDAKTGQIVDANKAAAEFYKWPVEALKQMNICDLSTVSSEVVKSEMVKATTMDRYSVECHHRKADGTIRDVEVFTDRIDINGNDLLFSIIHDITERKRSESRILALNEELERRVEERTLALKESQAQVLHAEKLSAIGKLSASIAHEFNSPLQCLLTVLKGMKIGTALNGKDRELLDTAINESERMKKLIQNLQDFNRPSSGMRTMIDVHAIIDSLLLLLKSDFKRKGIAAVVHYADRLPHILAVHDQIKQVFLNLLTNAADACASSVGVITISTWQVKQRIAVAIKDNGIGIAPEKTDLIFQPFYSTKPEIKGTGLGLSICHGIVQDHHGEIRVASEPGDGATFTVLLPIDGG